MTVDTRDMTEEQVTALVKTPIFVHTKGYINDMVEAEVSIIKLRQIAAFVMGFYESPEKEQLAQFEIDMSKLKVEIRNERKAMREDLAKWKLIVKGLGVAIIAVGGKVGLDFLNILMFG